MAAAPGAVRATVAQTPALRIVRGAKGYAPPPSDTAPLPAEVMTALRAVAKDLRNAPRDVLVDRQELILWLARLARRVDGVAALRAAFTPPAPKRSPVALQGLPAAQASSGARENVQKGHDPVLQGHALAAAVFGKGSGAPDPLHQATQTVRSPKRRDETRTVTSRRGKSVPVMIRRAREAGQMEMSV